MTRDAANHIQSNFTAKSVFLFDCDSTFTPAIPFVMPFIEAKMKKAALAVLLSVLGALPLCGCSSKTAEAPAEPASQVAQGPSAYDKYKQEISGLSQVGVKTRDIADAEDKAAFVIAVEDWPSYLAATQKLEARIKADATVEGSESAGQKAQLLTALRNETTGDSPRIRAETINRKTGEKIFQQFAIHGKDALRMPGVSAAAISYIGFNGVAKFHGYDEAGIALEAKRVFVDSPLTATR